MNEKVTLIVEDDPALRSQIKLFLSLYYKVVLAEDLKSASALIKSQSFDLILIDKSLPDGNGLSLISEIKKTQRNAGIVMLTFDSDLESINQALTLGADDYIIKSENILPHLLTRIPIILKNSKLKRENETFKNGLNLPLPQSALEINSKTYNTFAVESEMKFLEHLLALVSDDVDKLSKLIEVSRSTLFRKISIFGIGKQQKTETFVQNWSEPL